jgi:hypothetical protein
MMLLLLLLSALKAATFCACGEDRVEFVSSL